jgi:hypothetical protein
MGFNTKKFALALSETAGIAYVICVVLVAIAPNVAWKLAGWISHMTNLEVLGRGVTVSGSLLGLAEILVYTYLFGWLLASLYNRALK